MSRPPWLIITPVVLLLAAFMAIGRLVHRPRPGDDFAFISKLFGKPRNATGFQRIPGFEYQCYKFSASPQEVLDAVRSELGEPTFQDGLTTTIFVTHHRVKVVMIPLASIGKAETAILISGPASVIRPVRERFGIRDDGRETEKILFQFHGDLYTESATTSNANQSNVTVTWFNTTDADYSVNLSEDQEDQFDPIEPMPMTIAIPALSKSSIKLTYPTDLDAQEDKEEWIRYSSTTSEGPGPNMQAPFPHPLSITIDPLEGAKRSLVIFPEGTISNRPMEVKSVKVTLAGKPILVRSDLVRSAPGHGLRIPFTFNEDQRRHRLRIAFDYRLWPNQRWRASTDH